MEFKTRENLRSLGIVLLEHPGLYVIEELSDRCWSIADLASHAELEVPLLRNLTSGLHKVTPEIAAGLAKAFGTSAELWENLQRNYDENRKAVAEQNDVRLANADRDALLSAIANPSEPTAALRNAFEQFGRAVLQEFTEVYCDLDGIWLQEKAVECGLLKEVIATEPCREDCGCADIGFPATCYRVAT